MIAAWLAFFDGLLAIALVAAGIVAAYFYLTTPIVGFTMAMIAGFFIGILGTICGIVGMVRTGNPARSAARPRAVVGLVLSLIVAVPVLVLFLAGRKYPPINDITTDFDNPPEFVFATKLGPNANRNMKYDKAKFADRQSAGYGELKPLKMESDPASAFAKVKDTAGQMPSWQVTSTDPTSMTLEGVCTSHLFHFQDDFVIQVRPADGGGSLVEMRSKSRDGIGDFGMNHKRIQAFFARLKGDSTAPTS